MHALFCTSSCDAAETEADGRATSPENGDPRYRPGRRSAGCLLTAGLFLGLTLASPPHRAQAQQAGGAGGVPFTVEGMEAAATSGDAVVVDDLPVQLIGIAAPVPGQMCRNRYGRLYDCFATSRAVLANLVKDRRVVCRVVYVNSAGENIGHCSIGIDLSKAMVVRGWAFARRGLTHDYKRMETYAQMHRRGMWSGHVERPWQWQARQQRDQPR